MALRHEDQTGRIDAILVGHPLLASPCYVRTIPLAADQSLLCNSALVVDELPDHSIVDVQASLGQLADKARRVNSISRHRRRSHSRCLPTSFRGRSPPMRPRGKAAGLAVSVYPADRCADRNIRAAA